MNMLPDNAQSSDVVRIDILRWNGAGTNEIVGFIYELKRGDSWFGARKSANMTEAGFAEVRRWLRLTARPEALREGPFDPRESGYTTYQLKHGWRRTLSKQKLSTSSCVAWPISKPLPSSA